MKRPSPRTLLVVALAMVAGCSKDQPTQPWVGGWVSARVTFDDGVVRTEAVTYRSGGS